MFRCISVRMINLVFSAVCSVLLLSACGNHHANDPVSPRLVTLKVTLPQDEVSDVDSPASRSGNPITGIAEESKIESVKFFVYDADNGDAFETYATSVGNSMWDAATQTLRITVTQGNKKIYCIANWTDGSSGMATIANNVAMVNLLSKTRIHTNFALSNPPVMTGYLATNIVGNETNLTIQLRRQIARVELAFKLSDELNAGSTANVQINGVKFLNLPSESYVFPQSTVISPGGITHWGQTAFTGVQSAMLTGSSVDYATKYYLPEHAPASAATATLMVISATYNTVQTYYAIDINPAENLSFPHPAYVIERNHTYQYTITIEGRGTDAAPTRSAIDGSASISYELEIK